MKEAAAGIKIKLLVTAWGLMVGIPAYIFYTYFNSTVNRLILEVEEAGTELQESVMVRLAGAKSTTTDVYHKTPA